jgi:hypothetical protein
MRLENDKKNKIIRKYSTICEWRNIQLLGYLKML